MTFQAQLERMQLNLSGCIEGLDPIHLHDLRVANRRTRAALVDFRKLLPPEALQKYQDDFRWLHKVTGTVRDLDVGLSHFPVYEKKIPGNWRSHLTPSRELLVAKRQAAQAEMSAHLGSEKMRNFLNSWSALLEGGALDESELALEPAREYGCRRIVKRYQKTRKHGLKLGKKSPAKQYHDVRIRVKELRYLIEFFSPALDPGEIARVRGELKKVQDALGRFQDADVQVASLIQLAKDLQSTEINVEPFLALGQLVGIYEKEIRRGRKTSLKAVRWLASDAVAREFQSSFKYPIE